MSVTISGEGMVGRQVLNQEDLQEMAQGNSVSDRAKLDENRFKRSEITKKELSLISSETCCLKHKERIMCEQYQTVIMFRCGRVHSDDLHPRGHFGPGEVKYFPKIDTGAGPGTRPIVIDLRDLIERVPDHEFLTNDAKVVRSSAQIVYQIIDPVKCVVNSRNPITSTKLLCATIMAELGSKNSFKDLVLNKKELGRQILQKLDPITCNYGIRLERIDLDIKDMNRSLNNFAKKFFTDAPKQQVKPSAPPSAPIIINISNNASNSNPGTNNQAPVNNFNNTLTNISN